MFNGYIFDGAFIGQYLFGVHTHHTHKNIETQNGLLQLLKTNQFSNFIKWVGNLLKT